MRLSYRGTEYEPELSTVETIDRGVMGQYRGQAYSVRYPRHIPAQPVHTLNYRSVTYATMPDGSHMSVPGRLRTNDLPVRWACDTASIGSSFHRVQRDEMENVHRQNIQRRLVQRIQAAKQRGDQQLLQQLEREMNLFV
ncbi:DUF4278 domain-containing protein [Leptolyngbya sp. FACHB-711]|uniref:DUF4278 domain-containing protein n=1 Tax=unclassified Leptolyngbya TaxID=2650499 RepID=UPI0016830241|nr:DUF4278 domain-containing protein [Leptolyngbya sp. FACHB-711]MBD1851548.1 DUF4278 domain-containing protein [Cyanobacteria bacterium FACHB-502]MBD2025025.1 DUF4278 domain-containing protein [Leptolyngbya sp. FACHB-711]